MSESSARARDPKLNQKNRAKDASGNGWCTDDLYFDEEGCIYVANKDLAAAIQASLDAWHGHLTIYRDRLAGETLAVEAAAESPLPVDRPGGWLPITGKSGDGGNAAPEESGPGSTSTAVKVADAKTTTTTVYSGPKTNMMCPCAPEP